MPTPTPLTDSYSEPDRRREEARMAWWATIGGDLATEKDAHRKFLAAADAAVIDGMEAVA